MRAWTQKPYYTRQPTRGDTDVVELLRHSEEISQTSRKEELDLEDVSHSSTNEHRDSEDVSRAPSN